jgi:hypothetical protein
MVIYAPHGSSTLKTKAVLASCALFTIALLIPLTTCVKAIWADNVSFQHEGLMGLTLIIIGLVTTWVGLYSGVRWAWFVMFIIVWCGGFPILVLPLFRHKWSLTFSEWIYSSMFQSGTPRLWALSVVVFALMLLALVLPVQYLFLRRGTKSPKSGECTERN